MFLYDNEIKPDYIVGDFDSVPRKLVEYYREELDVPVREFNPVKDASDTEIALRLCLGLNRKKIVILGATGNRIDHLWANVQCLQIALEAGADACIMDCLLYTSKMKKESMRMKKDIRAYEYEELQKELERLGEKPFRAKQIYEWLHVKLADRFDEMTNLSVKLREKLAEEYDIFPVQMAAVSYTHLR